MDFDKLMVIFDVLIWVGCFYCLYSWHIMKRDGVIYNNRIIIPANASIDACKDQTGYLAYMLPRLLMFSIVGIVFGGLNLLAGYGWFPPAVGFALIMIILANIIYLSIVIKKSYEKFW